MRILLVEDDPMIGEAVRDGLKLEGFTVDWVRDGKAADVALDTGDFAVALLDLGLPQKGGLEILKTLRARKHAIPVLVITARDTVKDRVAGLDAGADDYLVKPFDLDELAARVRALIRRSAGRPEPIVEHGPITINPATREVTVRGNAVSLSAREYALLAALTERPGIVLSRSQLEDRLYGWGEEVGSNAVEVHIHNLRRKLGEDVIRNVRGVGYTIPTGTST
jgi:two-component system response regulator QseB